MNTSTGTFPFDFFTQRFINFDTPSWDTWKIVYDTPEPKYPPYDIEKDGEKTVLIFAVAGFKKDELSVTHVKREKKLQISGTKKEERCGCEREGCNCLIKKGIAKRPFNIEFAINDAKVASSKLENGLLTVVVEPVEPPKDEVETIEIK